jgi:hypothetical protein
MWLGGVWCRFRLQMLSSGFVSTLVSRHTVTQMTLFKTDISDRESQLSYLAGNQFPDR